MSTSPSQRIFFRAPNELANEIKKKNNFSEWIRMALIERLERERLERLADSKQRDDDE